LGTGLFVAAALFDGDLPKDGEPPMGCETLEDGEPLKPDVDPQAASMKTITPRESTNFGFFVVLRMFLISSRVPPSRLEELGFAARWARH
jgi:hypothetical protein